MRALLEAARRDPRSAARGATHERLLAVARCVLLALAGCESAMRDMYDQPQLRAVQESAAIPDGGASQPPSPGTVARARGTLAGNLRGREGADEELRRQRDRDAAVNPVLADARAARRGRDRYDIYCSPCHSSLGDGDGYVDAARLSASAVVP